MHPLFLASYVSRSKKNICHDERSSVLSSPVSGSMSGGGLRHVAMNRNTATMDGLTRFSTCPALPLPHNSSLTTDHPPTLPAAASMVDGTSIGQLSALRDDALRTRTASTTDATDCTDCALSDTKSWPPFSKNKLQLRPRNKRKRRDVRMPTEFSRWDEGLQRMISWET